MSVTGKYFFARKITVQYPEEKLRRASVSAACMRCAARTERSAASPASCARPFVRPWPSPSNPNPRRRFAAHDALRHRSDQVYFLRLLQEACPVDAVVETRIFEYHGEKRGDLYYTKPMLLANGDRYEAQIAADREMDDPYR